MEQTTDVRMQLAAELAATAGENMGSSVLESLVTVDPHTIIRVTCDLYSDLISQTVERCTEPELMMTSLLSGMFATLVGTIAANSHAIQCNECGSPVEPTQLWMDDLALRFGCPTCDARCN